MASVSEILSLKGLSGRPLLDKTSSLLGMSQPSDYNKPIDTQRPGDLIPLAEKWRGVAAEVLEHSEELRAATNRALNAWDGDAAEKFATDYMPKLYKVLEAQKGAIDQIPGKLEEMKKTMEGAKEAIHLLELGSAATVIGALVAFAAGVAVGAAVGELTLPAVTAAFVATCVAALLALLGESYFVRKKREGRLDDLRGALAQLTGKNGILSAEKIHTVSPPPPPEITTKGFDYKDFFPKE